ncbi:hypothetical protein F4780DRAFT_747684 [Xylariomycetidae sp. FL0641]|nr:hypothetical protein F4780DRAFT_747684 [Xylariomycetidae sp. FL0641]
MDPLSITMACLTFTKILHKAMKSAHSFLEDVWSAEPTVLAAIEEFTSAIPLFRLINTPEFQHQLPEEVRGTLAVIIGDCTANVDEMESILACFQDVSGLSKVQWASYGKPNLEKQNKALHHRLPLLGVVLDVANLYVRADHLSQSHFDC